MWDDFKGSRWSEDPPLAPVAKCGEHHSWPFHNFQGWESNCYVDVATNVYLGVPAKSDDRYVFHFHTRHVSSPTLRVYINGRYYTAHKAGDDYTADVLIDRRRLTSPIVMTSIEWTHDLEPIAREELLSVDLT
jgi:hypothetical protein